MKVAGHDFEVAAVIAVVEIPVHVAQKRIRFCLLVPILPISQCLWPLEMSWANH